MERIECLVRTYLRGLVGLDLGRRKAICILYIVTDISAPGVVGSSLKLVFLPGATVEEK